MKSETKKRTELIIHTFNSLSKDNLSVLNEFYDKTIRFTDPVTEVIGIMKLTKYYVKVYKNVIAIKFNFHEIVHQDDSAFAKWTMTLQVKGLNSQRPYDTEGFSVLKFNAQNKVVYHRDYLDLGSMVYEHIPLLGKAIKLIKKALK